MISRSVSYNFKCPKCGKEKQYIPRGENHPNWKGGITTEAQSLRKSPQYENWRTSVYEKDDYTCQCCGTRGGRLTAHHIHDYATYENERLNIDNGITLCFNCHDSTIKGSFHNTYGTHGKTPEELEQYINNRRKELGILIPFNIDEYRKGNILKPDTIEEAKNFMKEWNFDPYINLKYLFGEQRKRKETSNLKIKSKYKCKEE